MVKKIISAIVFIPLALSCGKDNDTVDTVYPSIDISSSGTFPVQCSTIRRGESFVFKASFSDNVALGSYGLDIHHNFDHHTHSTEVEECDMGPVKDPENPFVLIKSVDIPDSPKRYDAAMEIEVPADIDPGDYHFMIRVTDKAGWQTMKGLSIKIQ